MAYHNHTEKEIEAMMGDKLKPSKKKGKKKSAKFIGAKIRKIKKEGIRGKKVSRKQAIAVALSMARKKGFKVKKKT